MQRGRLRARYSPCQKSTENLAVQSKYSKRNLMRSLSVPNQDQGATEKEKKTQANTLRAVSEKQLTDNMNEHEHNHGKVIKNENIISKESAVESNSMIDQVIDTRLDLGKCLSESLDNSLKDSLDFQLDEVSRFLLFVAI